MTKATVRGKRIGKPRYGWIRIGHPYLSSSVRSCEILLTNRDILTNKKGHYCYVHETERDKLYQVKAIGSKLVCYLFLKSNTTSGNGFFITTPENIEFVSQPGPISNRCRSARS